MLDLTVWWGLGHRSKKQTQPGLQQSASSCVWYQDQSTCCKPPWILSGYHWEGSGLTETDVETKLHSINQWNICFKKTEFCDFFIHLFCQLLVAYMLLSNYLSQFMSSLAITRLITIVYKLLKIGSIKMCLCVILFHWYRNLL